MATNYSKQAMARIFRIMLFIFWSIQTIQAQEENQNYPKIGEQCPDYVFRDVVDFPTGRNKISDFRGKWLLLDFWSTGCSSCIGSFPKMNKIQQDFRENIQLIMVGYNKRREKNRIRSMYELFKKRYNLDFAVAFDSTLFERFAIDAVPCIVLVDPGGRIRGYAGGIDSLQIRNIIAGKQVELERYMGRRNESKPWDSYRRNELLLTNGNGGNDTSFMFRSVFTQWTPEMPVFSFKGLSDRPHEISKKGTLEALGMEVPQLLRYAFFGANFWNAIPTERLFGKATEIIIVKHSDSVVVNQLLNSDERYSYSLTVPPHLATDGYLLKRMQQDLMDYFSINASVEKVRKKQLRVAIIDSTLFAKNISNETSSKPHVEANDIPYTGFKFTNANGDDIINVLRLILMDGGYEFIANELPHELRINMDFHCFVKDFDAVRVAFEKYGIGLIEDTIVVDAIVIRD